MHPMIAIAQAATPLELNEAALRYHLTVNGILECMGDRDFLFLHIQGQQQDESFFWRLMQEMAVPTWVDWSHIAPMLACPTREIATGKPNGVLYVCKDIWSNDEDFPLTLLLWRAAILSKNPAMLVNKELDKATIIPPDFSPSQVLPFTFDLLCDTYHSVALPQLRKIESIHYYLARRVVSIPNFPKFGESDKREVPFPLK